MLWDKKAELLFVSTFLLLGFALPARAIDGPLYAPSVQVLTKKGENGGAGSGVVVKNVGSVSLVLTSKHVVVDKTSIRVKSPKGEWDAKILELFEKDGALLEIPARLTPAVVPLPNERPAPGSPLTVVGCPFMICYTRTDGYLTTTDAEGDYFTSATVAAGSSGGGAFWFSPNKRWVLIGIARGMWSNNLAFYGMMGMQTLKMPVPSINIVTPLASMPELHKWVKPTPLERW